MRPQPLDTACGEGECVLYLNVSDHAHMSLQLVLARIYEKVMPWMDR